MTQILFRMKYQPCNGRCYEYDDVLKLHPFGLDAQQTAVLLDRIIKIHEPACGNENMGYGLDFDEETNIFVSSFFHYGALDLFVASTPLEALNKLIDAALNWFSSEDGKEKLTSQPGLGHNVCEHGEDQDLRHFALKYSGLNPDLINNVLAA